MPLCVLQIDLNGSVEINDVVILLNVILDGVFCIGPL